MLDSPATNTTPTPTHEVPSVCCSICEAFAVIRAENPLVIEDKNGSPTHSAVDWGRIALLLGDN